MSHEPGAWLGRLVTMGCWQQVDVGQHLWPHRTGSGISLKCLTWFCWQARQDEVSKDDPVVGNRALLDNFDDPEGYYNFQVRPAKRDKPHSMYVLL